MIRTYKYGEVAPEDIFARTEMPANVENIVSEIIDAVRRDGDEALRQYNLEFDRSREPLEVTPEEIDEAYRSVDPELIEILEEAAANIREFHSRQKRNSFILNEKPGIVMGQKVVPIERAGLYVPGGTAAYPSTVLMNCIPAHIAGVSEIIITTPATDGMISPVLLAAAKIGGANRIFRVGGAQAVAALAYGTETIPAVDKIVGPGNAFVAEAKKQVYGRVSIDMIAGPSEILIVADGTCVPEAVPQELEKQLKVLPREEIARASIDHNGKIILTEDIETAIDIANEIAPEHFELCVDNPFDYLDRIRNAGSIFLGKNCPEALGDYFAGPNHTLPTGGTARFNSPLSVDDFTKKMQYSYYTEDALAKIADKVARFAAEEGLDAHGRSVLVRKNRKER